MGAEHVPTPGVVVGPVLPNPPPLGAPNKPPAVPEPGEPPLFNPYLVVAHEKMPNKRPIKILIPISNQPYLFVLFAMFTTHLLNITYV